MSCDVIKATDVAARENCKNNKKSLQYPALLRSLISAQLRTCESDTRIGFKIEGTIIHNSVPEYKPIFY